MSEKATSPLNSTASENSTDSDAEIIANLDMFMDLEVLEADSQKWEEDGDKASAVSPSLSVDPSESSEPQKSPAENSK